MRVASKEAEAILRDFALAYPESHEDFPWGERVIKVRNKVFVFLGCQDGGLHVVVKLPASATLALTLPFASPTGYGLARSGWVTARFGPREKPPVAVLKQWIDESYRAVAPRKLVGTLSEPGSAEGKRPATRVVDKPRSVRGGGRKPRRK